MVQILPIPLRIKVLILSQTINRDEVDAVVASTLSSILVSLPFVEIYFFGKN